MHGYGVHWEILEKQVIGATRTYSLPSTYWFLKMI